MLFSTLTCLTVSTGS